MFLFCIFLTVQTLIRRWKMSHISSEFKEMKHHLIVSQFIHWLWEAGGHFPVNQSSWHKSAWIIQLLWALMFPEQHEILNTRSAMALELPRLCPSSSRLVWLVSVSPIWLIMFLRNQLSYSRLDLYEIYSNRLFSCLTHVWNKHKIR